MRRVYPKEMKQMNSQQMENVVGVLRLIVKRGIKLAIRDFRSSDPYVTVSFGKQKVRTRTIKNSLNPEWNDELTLCVTEENQNEPLVLSVYDSDMLSADDEMGYAEVDLKQFIELSNTTLGENMVDGTIISTLKPCRENCLSEGSDIIWMDGKVTHNMYLRLRNVECGEIEIQIEWTEARGRFRA